MVSEPKKLRGTVSLKKAENLYFDQLNTYVHPSDWPEIPNNFA
jgi:hypothetical protein